MVAGLAGRLVRPRRTGLRLSLGLSLRGNSGWLLQMQFSKSFMPCLFVAWLASASFADGPVPAGEATRHFKLPAGFQATLFAGEPDVVQPIAFTFDDRGRLWVVENHSYPGWAGEGHDRVLIFTDRDGDGRFDERKVFL